VPAGARGQYAGRAAQCAGGCRLTGFTMAGSDDDLILTLFGLHTPTTTVLDAAALAAAGRWDGASASAAGGGLRVYSEYDPLDPGPTTVALRDITGPVPVLSTVTGLKKVTGPDGHDVDAEPAGLRAGVLPRLGGDGTLIDLTTIDDVGLAATTSGDAEVWLGPHAPTSAVAQLRAAGLAVASESTERSALRDLAATGPALALQFHLAAAALGLLLALGALAVVALVDRPARSADLRALRRQGLSPRVVTRVAVGGYLSVVLAASVAGLAAAAVAWVLTGTALPVYGPSGSVVPTDPWPRAGDVLSPWALVTVLLAAGAIVAGWTLRRAVAADTDAGVRRGPTRAVTPANRTAVPRASTRTLMDGRTLPDGRPLTERETAMAGLAVTCRRVVQIYRAEAGDVVALAGVDLTIAPGETLALVGPSGSGKSTLIALLAGLMRPSAGRITLGTYDLGRLSDGEITRLRGTEIGVVLQGAARNLLPYATIGKNIQVAQARAAQTRGIRLDDPAAILDLVGLAGFGDAHIVDLPPGAQQRAALAVGIATGPGLLLVDEPTSQLDTHGRDEVIGALETVSRERGTTIVVVTHDNEVGNRLGRAVTIRDGRVGAEGRGGQDFAVVAGDGTVQLPPEVLGDFPPGTLFTVERTASSVSFALDADAAVHRTPAGGDVTTTAT
jgi:ABC-type lipoprotein export system ATPase subunit